MYALLSKNAWLIEYINTSERERMMGCPAFFDACWNAARADTADILIES